MARRTGLRSLDKQQAECENCGQFYPRAVSWQRFCAPVCREIYRRRHKHLCPRCKRQHAAPRKPRPKARRHVRACTTQCWCGEKDRA